VARLLVIPGRTAELGIQFAGIVALFNINVTAKRHTRFVCQGRQKGLQQFLVVEFEAGDAAHARIRVAVLDRQITNLGFDETRWERVDRRNLACDRCRRGLPLVRVGESRGDRLVGYGDLFWWLLIFEEQAIVGVVESQRAFHRIPVTENTALVFRLHGRRCSSRRWRWGFSRLWIYRTRTLGKRAAEQRSNEEQSKNNSHLSLLLVAGSVSYGASTQTGT